MMVTEAPSPPAPQIAAPPLDKRPEAIRGMFARVAPVYDLLNHLLSASLDRVWRRKAARAIDFGAAPALDLCCGTGDQALALQRRGARVAAADFCLPMVVLARRKFAKRGDSRSAAKARETEQTRAAADAGRELPTGAAMPAPLVADALTLPFPTSRFRAATVSFGLRNVVDLDAAIRELARVTAPGGQLAVLEFAVPRLRPLRALYLFYFQRLLPRIGRWISNDGGAYSYLPASVLAFPQRQELADRFRAAGFDEARWEDLAGGIVCFYSARRAR
ncbi:MAG TPA: class I SAM-dependent methyltransferase [Thermoanaerobaculia bacterium]|jgi:demethylmenaquinone methyltransferase/2-methoxy-6-polyprenyl-1,4-benzoquinol methylase|nr:class I SAM-dependent methyltransferase [Thermoanaerobaculia bacterium]